MANMYLITIKECYPMGDKTKRVLHIGGKEIPLMTGDDPAYLRRL